MNHRQQQLNSLIGKQVLIHTDTAATITVSGALQRDRQGSYRVANTYSLISFAAWQVVDVQLEMEQITIRP